MIQPTTIAPSEQRPRPGALIEAICRDLIALTGTMGIDWFRRRLFNDSPCVFVHTRVRTEELEPTIYLNFEALAPDGRETAHKRIHFQRQAVPARERIAENGRTLAETLDARIRDRRNDPENPVIGGPCESDFSVRINLVKHANNSIHARVHFDIGTLRYAPNPLKPADASARLDSALDALDRIRALDLASDFRDPALVGRYEFPEAEAAVERWRLRGGARDLVQRNPVIAARSGLEAWLIRETWIAVMAGRPLPEISDEARQPASEVAEGRFSQRLAAR